MHAIYLGIDLFVQMSRHTADDTLTTQHIQSHDQTIHGYSMTTLSTALPAYI